MAGLTLHGVSKSFGAVPVLHDIDLDIADGEFVVFVGPSGCGKSTLLRIIAGLEGLNAGDIAIDGVVVNDVPAVKRGLAMVFQSYALYPHMSVRKNLSFGLETIGAPKALIAERIAEAARILQIEPLFDRRPGQLSGGQRQRVAIGRAIVREPKVFLFDEPLSNLDAELRVQMRVEINKLHQRLGATMIFVTHDQVEAMTMADRIVVLRSGRVEQVGTPLDLYNRPTNLFVAGFIGSPRMNFLKGSLLGEDAGGAQIRLGTGTLISLPLAPGRAAGTEATLGIRPESVRIAQDGDGAPSTQGQVQIAEHLGASTLVYLSLPSDETITVEVPGQLQVRAGEHVPVAFDPAACHVFDGNGAALARR